MRLCLFFNFLFVIINSLLFAQEASTPPPSVFVFTNETITSHTVWQGEVQVPQRLDVAANVNLTIMPGTVVRFAKDRGMWVNGYLRAVGEKDRPIRFTILGEPEEGEHWHQIMIENGFGVFEHCIFEYGDVALHSHFSQLSVRKTTFSHNGTGMMFKGGPVVIRDAAFRGNGFGLVFNRARGQLLDSLVTGNEVGIMVRAEEQTGNMVVRSSDIYANSRYNLKMGDFNNGIDIDVRENWWGTEKPEEMIFDARVEEGIGRAVLAPASEKAFQNEKLRVKNEKFRTAR